MRRFLALLISCLFLLAGCGYHTPGSEDQWIGGDADILYIELFANRSYEPYLENFVTDEVIFQFSRSRVVELTERMDEADLIMQGTILDFDADAESYDPNDRITEYDAYIRVMVQLVRTSDDTVIWKKTLSRTQSYPATVNKTLQLEGQELAAREIAKRLSEDIYARMFSEF